MKTVYPFILLALLAGCSSADSQTQSDSAATSQQYVVESYEVTPEDQGVAAMVDAEPATPKGEVLDISIDQFKTLVANITSSPDQYIGSRPAIVDFWAPWCGPCLQLSPILHQLAADTGILVYKVNVDNAQALCELYGIQAIPTVFFCTPGQTIRRVTGIPPVEELTSFANQGR